MVYVKNENDADIKATNRKFDFKDNFSGNIGGNGLFSGQNKLVLTNSNFFVLDSLDKISAANVKNGTDIRATYRKFGWWSTAR